MINFLSHWEQGKWGPSSSLWFCFLWRTRFLFCTCNFPHSGQRCRPPPPPLCVCVCVCECFCCCCCCGVEVTNGWTVVSISISAETSIKLSSVTADTSICNMESWGLVSNPSGMTYVNCQKEQSPGRCSGLEHGTAMHSGSEHRKTGRAFSYSSNATSKYSLTVMVHHIMHEILNNMVTITKMHQVTAFSCRFWGKFNSACKRSKSKNENVWLWGVQETKCQEIYTTGHGKVSTFQP